MQKPSRVGLAWALSVLLAQQLKDQPDRIIHVNLAPKTSIELRAEAVGPDGLEFVFSYYVKDDDNEAEVPLCADDEDLQLSIYSYLIDGKVRGA